MDTLFFKSTYSGANQSCVEVALLDGTVLVRDSKYGGAPTRQPVVSIASAQWPAVLDLALNSASEYSEGDISITVHTDGSAVIAGQGHRLSYTADEWSAFAKGVADGEFALGRETTRGPA